MFFNQMLPTHGWEVVVKNPMSVTIILTIEWLKTIQICYFTVLEARSPRIKVSDCIPSASSRGESTSLPFPVSRGCLHSLAHGCITPTSASFVTSLILARYIQGPNYNRYVLCHLDPLTKGA